MAISEGTILKIVMTILFEDSSLMQNVFSSVLTSAGGSDDEQDVADDMAEWMDECYTNLLAIMYGSLQPTDVTVYEWDAVDEDWDEVGTGTPTWNPTAADNLLPRGAAAVINANTIDPDVQGRKYIGGLTENGYSQLGWSAGVLTALSAFTVDWTTQFVGSATGATFTPTIWSPTVGVAKIFSGVASIPVFAGYQRRRKEGVGV